MKHLTQYVEQINFTRRIFKEPLLEADNLGQGDIQLIHARLNNAFTPENLTCDGELSHSQVQKRIKFLNGVKKDLEKVAGHPIEIDV